VIRNWLRSTLVAAGAVAVVSGTAGAQATFNFSTRGQFASLASTCNNLAPGTVVVCADPTVGSTLQLTFTGQPVNPLNFGNGTTVTLGNFAVSGTGNIAAVLPGAVNFTLYIDQVHPTVGTATTVGSISGSIMRDATSATGGLIWQPVPEIVTIGGVRYDLVFENVNGQIGVAISAAANSSIEAVGTVVPEPSTYVLMAAGMAGLGLVARRRRSA
jgi:hypothetical protein